MKILVGISGGVDSAYAAKKLMLEGHDVEGAVLIMHQNTEVGAAREAAESFVILLLEIDCTTAFEEIKKNFVILQRKRRKSEGKGYFCIILSAFSTYCSGL